MGLASCDRASLEPCPPTELVAATDEMGQRRPDPGLVPLPFLPVVDGVFLPDAPLGRGGEGAAAGVDLMIGTNRDELTLFGLGNPALLAMDEQGLSAGWPTRCPTSRRRGDRGLPGRAPTPGPNRPRSRTSGSPPAPTSSSAGRACSWRPPMAPGRGPSPTSSTGSRRPSTACWARPTRSSCRSSSAPCTFRWCSCSRAEVPPRTRCPDRCRWRGSPLPARGPLTRGHRRVAPVGTAGRATMVFGARTGLVERRGQRAGRAGALPAPAGAHPPDRAPPRLARKGRWRIPEWRLPARQVLDDCPAGGTVATGLGRVGHGSWSTRSTSS